MSHLSRVIKQGVYLGADAKTIERAEKKPGALWCARPPQPNTPRSRQIIVGEQLARAQRGEAFVLARFDTFTVGSQVLVIPEGAPPALQLPGWNLILPPQQ